MRSQKLPLTFINKNLHKYNTNLPSPDTSFYQPPLTPPFQGGGINGSSIQHFVGFLKIFV